jgi:putative salt-induced outer membrane protein
MPRSRRARSNQQSTRRTLRWAGGLIFSFCAFWWAFHPLRVQAEELRIHLRNGDRVSGSLVSEDKVQITLTNAVLGRMVVPLAQIERRERITNSVPTTLATGMTRTNTPAADAAAVDAGAVQRLRELSAGYVAGRVSSESYHRQRAELLATLGPAGALAAAATTNQIAAGPRKVPAPKHWSGEAQTGVDLGFGEKERQLYTGRFKLNYTHAPVRNALDYQATYGKTDGELAANRMDGSMKTDYDLTHDYYLYSLAGGGYDELRKIDWRYEVGPGMGYNLLKRTNLVLRVEGGFHYDVTNFEENKQDDIYYHRLAQDLKWNWSSLITIDEKLEYSPQFETFSEYRLRFEANLRLWLRSNLFLSLSVINLFDTVTAPGVPQNDLQVRSSVGVRF